MPPSPPPDFDSSLLSQEPSKLHAQIAQLQEELAKERDARREERFVFIVLTVLLLDIVFFSVMESFGGPLALLILELLILIPLARRMGMEEIAALLDRVLSRVIAKSDDGE
jgi:hypothetical protein